MSTEQEEAKGPPESADMSEMLLVPQEGDQQQEEHQPATDSQESAPVPADGEDQISDAPLVYESQTIDINGVRHEIINQGQDETGQPVVVLKNVETGEHVVLPLSALVGESADGTDADDSMAIAAAAAAGDELPDDATHPSEPQAEGQTAVGDDAAVAQLDDGSALSCVPSAPHDSQADHTEDADAAASGTEQAADVVAASDMGVDQLQTLADQAAGAEQQLLHPIQAHPEVNGINGDLVDQSVLQAAQVSDASAVNQITFDASSVIDVAGNGANGSSLEALVAGATVVAGEDGNQFVILPSEDGSATGQQINFADVIGEGNASGETYLIQTDEGLVACSAAPEVVEKSAPSPIDQIASNEQAILEAVLASGNFSNGQVIHAVAGDQTMAYTVQINNEGAALIPIGPVVNNAPPSPKKILGKSRSHADSVMSGGRSLTSAQRANQARKNQSNVQFANSRQASPANRSQLASGSKLPASNQVTVTRINPPSSRSSQQSPAASTSLSSDVSLLTAVTGPSQLASSRRTYSKKNILWVNPESSSKAIASSDSAGIEKGAGSVPALVSTNTNMTVSAMTVSTSPQAEKAVSPIAKKQNPILTTRAAKPVSPPKQQVKESAKEELPVRDVEKKREVKKDVPKPSLPEPIKKSAEKSSLQQRQQQQKAQDEAATPKKANEENIAVGRKSETSPKKKEPEVRAVEAEPTRRSNRASKRSSKVDDEVAAAAVPDVKVDEAEVTAPAEEPASQKEVVAEPISKRNARRSTSTDKREEATPLAPKSARTRGRAFKAPVEADTPTNEVQQTEEKKAVADVVADTPAASEPIVTAPEPDVHPEPVTPPAKSAGRRGRKAADKLPYPVDSGERSMSESESAPPETPSDSEAAPKSGGSVRRSGRASKRKVEEDFVSEIEPEALGERPTRRSRTEPASPEKDVRSGKEEKQKEKVAEKTVKSIVNEDVQPVSAVTNSHSDPVAVDDVVVPVVEKKKESIAVTPKKRVGFREAVDETSPPTASKRSKGSADEVKPQEQVVRRPSTETKLTPILKPSKETPKGRRLATPIICSFTDVDEEEERRKLRQSISGLTEKRSQADHYEVSSPNLTIHVRHQSASSTPIQGSSTYACQKCGFSTSRINNLTLHHKNQCPVVLMEWQLGYQNEIKKQQSRPSSEPSIPALRTEENARFSDAESPVPESSDAVDHTPDVTSVPVQGNDSVPEPGPSSDKSDEHPVVENDTAAAPAADPTPPTTATAAEICPPSDDEEDGVTENDTGILKNNSHLFDNI